jgi:hypothetical protein
MLRPATIFTPSARKVSALTISWVARTWCHGTMSVPNGQSPQSVVIPATVPRPAIDPGLLRLITECWESVESL